MPARSRRSGRSRSRRGRGARPARPSRAPRVGGELGRKRPHRRTASAWAGFPSTPAGLHDRSHARPVGREPLHRHRLQERLQPEATDAARAPVGRTWFPAGGVVARGDGRPAARRPLPRSGRAAPAARPLRAGRGAPAPAPRRARARHRGRRRPPRAGRERRARARAGRRARGRRRRGRRPRRRGRLPPTGPPGDPPRRGGRPAASPRSRTRSPVRRSCPPGRSSPSRRRAPRSPAAPGRPDLGEAEELGRARDLPGALGRRHDGDALDAGNLRRHCAHDQRRDEPARHVDAHGAQRRTRAARRGSPRRGRTGAGARASGGQRLQREKRARGDVAVRLGALRLNAVEAHGPVRGAPRRRALGRPRRWRATSVIRVPHGRVRSCIRANLPKSRRCSIARSDPGAGRWETGAGAHHASSLSTGTSRIERPPPRAVGAAARRRLRGRARARRPCLDRPAG